MEYINKIYEQYANLIKNYIFLIVNDKELAEEIMQETFVVAITQINKFRGDCEISTWLCSIAKKILYKKTKRKSKKAIVSIEALQVESNINVEENYVKNEKKLKFYEVLQTLDAETREIMYLRLTGELTFKEIGKILNKSENWARVKFFRGKQKLNERNVDQIGVYCVYEDQSKLVFCLNEEKYILELEQYEENEDDGKKIIYIKAVGKIKLDQGEGNGTVNMFCETTIDEDTKKICIKDKRGNIKEIWNKQEGVLK